MLLLIENLKTVIGWQVFLSIESFRANLTSKKERIKMLSEKQKKFDEQKKVVKTKQHTFTGEQCKAFVKSKKTEEEV